MFTYVDKSKWIFNWYCNKMSNMEKLKKIELKLKKIWW
jgi:hypothetical protein